MRITQRMDDRASFKGPFKPKNYNIISLILWGNIVLDWQWAIQTLIWKEYHEI